jgi:hypothetical protein
MPQGGDETDGAGLERRQERRHAVERACRVASNVLHRDAVRGLTMNVSRTGMLVRFPDCDYSRLLPEVGSQARIMIDLPTSANYSPRFLECKGRVVREAGSPEDAPVLAFEIHHMMVRELKAGRGRKERTDDRPVQ